MLRQLPWNLPKQVRDVVCKVILFGRDLVQCIFFCFVVLILLKPCGDARRRLKTKRNLFSFSSKYNVILKLHELKLSQITIV